MHTVNDKRGVYLYGNVALVRELCPRCNNYSFVRKGVTVCCKEKINVPKLARVYRVTEAPLKRRKPGKQERDEILAIQNYECFYCGEKFGSVHRRHTKKVTLKLHWEHFVPFSYSQNNSAYNFTAACHVCNGIKGSLHFLSAIHAMVYIRLRRQEKGYDF